MVSAEPLFGGAVHKSRLVVLVEVREDTSELFPSERDVMTAAEVLDARVEELGTSARLDEVLGPRSLFIINRSLLRVTSLAWCVVGDLADRPADEAWRWLRRPHDCERRAIPVAYGLPGSEMIEEAAAGRVALGGCMPGGPANRCRTCGHEW